jgi:non-heme Fe2+,alpha-ketoglutarate-dependent halogenase
MPNTLAAQAVAQFRDNGYYFPHPVLDADEVADLRARTEAAEAADGGAFKPAHRNKSHLLYKWVDDLIRDPRILDPVEDLIGPNILCWNTIFWIKEAGSKSFVSWHQDSNYWGLDGGTVVSAWLALSPATKEAGCMRVMPGTHAATPLTHEDRYHGDNLLTRGQEIADPLDEAAAVSMPLAPGAMSFHDIRLAHASGPNQSSDRRIGLSMHFMPTRARQVVGEWDSAALVRGEDTFGHFHPAPCPKADFDPEAVRFHEQASLAVRDILYHGAENETAKL